MKGKMKKLHPLKKKIIEVLSGDSRLGLVPRLESVLGQSTVIILQLNALKMSGVEVRVYCDFKDNIVKVRHLYVTREGYMTCLEDQNWWEMERKLSIYAYKGNKNLEGFVDSFENFLQRSQSFLKRAIELVLHDKKSVA